MEKISLGCLFDKWLLVSQIFSGLYTYENVRKESFCHKEHYFAMKCMCYAFGMHRAFVIKGK